MPHIAQKGPVATPRNGYSSSSHSYHTQGTHKLMNKSILAQRLFCQRRGGMCRTEKEKDENSKLRPHHSASTLKTANLDLINGTYTAMSLVDM